jgi:hypothetical protein
MFAGWRTVYPEKESEYLGTGYLDKNIIKH